MADVVVDDHLEWIRERLAASGVDPTNSPETIMRIIDEAIDVLSGPLSVAEREDLAQTLQAAILGLGPLQPLLDDPSVEEIWLNSPSRVFVARNGVPELTTVILSDQEVRDLVERMLHHSGRRLDLSSPFVDAMLSGGERLHAVIPPVTAGHWSVNIRKHVQKARSLADLVEVGMASSAMAAFLRASVVAGLSIVVSGATQAGKTTLLRALLGEVPRTRRVISCEEVFELGLSNRDCVSLQTRPGNFEGRGEVTLRDLVRETLRMRPECLVVGEVRGAEALDLLLALNAGVPGMATVHANSAKEALSKLTMLPLLAGENVRSDFVVPTLASSVDLVCHVDRDSSGRRRVTQILYLPGRVEADRIETSLLWAFDGVRTKRASGSADLYARFAAAGVDLSSFAGAES